MLTVLLALKVAELLWLLLAVKEELREGELVREMLAVRVPTGELLPLKLAVAELLLHWLGEALKLPLTEPDTERSLLAEKELLCVGELLWEPLLLWLRDTVKEEVRVTDSELLPVRVTLLVKLLLTVGLPELSPLAEKVTLAVLEPDRELLPD